MHDRENTMDWGCVEVYWQQLSGSILQHWGRLTPEQLQTIAGNRVQLSIALQAVYGMNRNEANQQINAFAQGLRDIICCK